MIGLTFLKELMLIKFCYLPVLAFLDKGFRFQTYVCNGCHDFLMSINLDDIAILNIKGIHYRCNISRISKSEVVIYLTRCWLHQKKWEIK